MRELRAQIVPRIADIDKNEWDACFPGEVENYAYYAACQKAGPVGHEMSAAMVIDEKGMLAVVPVFEMTYRLDTPFQGFLKPLAAMLNRFAPSLVALSVIGLGSPYAECCHLGFRPGTTASDKRKAVAALIKTLEKHAAAHALQLIALKDLQEVVERDLAPILVDLGLTRVSSLPLATLDLVGTDEAKYLTKLSASTRKDLRRKLAKAKDVRIEQRYDISDIANEIEALYTSTREASGVDYGDFEMLPPGYFLAVSEALGQRAVFMLYWIGNTLAAFNLLLLEKDRLIDKFLGMRYPLARTHNLYALSWMTNVRFCLRRGVRTLQTGQTAYTLKVRYGSKLYPSAIYFRHRSKFANVLLKAIAPFLAFDKLDPELKAIKRAKF